MISLRNLRDASANGALVASLMRGQRGAARVAMIRRLTAGTPTPNQRGAFCAAAARRAGRASSARPIAPGMGVCMGGNDGAGGDRIRPHRAVERHQWAPITAPPARRWVFGGDVRGGRVVADWPGLNPAQLYGRPRPCAQRFALEGVLAGAVAEHFPARPGTRR